MRPLIPVYNISYFEIQRKINRNEELYKVSDTIDKEAAARLADFYIKGFTAKKAVKQLVDEFGLARTINALERLDLSVYKVSLELLYESSYQPLDLPEGLEGDQVKTYMKELWHDYAILLKDKILEVTERAANELERFNRMPKDTPQDTQRLKSYDQTLAFMQYWSGLLATNIGTGDIEVIDFIGQMAEPLNCVYLLTEGKELTYNAWYEVLDAAVYKNAFECSTELEELEDEMMM